MKLKINGEERVVAASSLADVLEALELDGANLAIEHNGKIVEEGEDYSKIEVHEGDALEIVRFVGGG